MNPYVGTTWYCEEEIYGPWFKFKIVEFDTHKEYGNGFSILIKEYNDRGESRRNLMSYDFFYHIVTDPKCWVHRPIIDPAGLAKIFLMDDGIVGPTYEKKYVLFREYMRSLS